MSKSRSRHHLLWGLVFMLLLIATIFTRHIIFYGSLCIPGGYGIGAGFGIGMLALGIVEDLPGIDYGINFKDDSYIWWFGTRDPFSGERVLIIPLWFVALFPIAFWAQSIWRIRRFENFD